MTKKTKEKNNLTIKLIIIVLLFTSLYSLYNIAHWLLNIHESNSIKQRISEKIDINKENEISVDFESLKKENPDTCGYLKLPGTKINYVVVKTDNNDYYLKHDFDKQSNVSGWVFANYVNKLDESDKNIVIFGHNMMDGSMFGELKKIFDDKWLSDKSNFNVEFITQNGEYTYEVFSIYKVKVEDYYLQNSFNSDNEFRIFKEKLKQRSVFDFNVNVNNEKSILTLSTCSGGNYRTVLHAILK